jgi:hypothetical protein
LVFRGSRRGMSPAPLSSVSLASKLMFAALLLAPSSGHAAEPSRRHLEKLEEGAGFKVVNPARAFGTPLAVRRLRETFERYHARYPEAEPIMVMDLSKHGGGRLRPHASHRTGRDVDVRYVLNCRTKYFVDAGPYTFDAERTWFLISTLIATGDVEFVFVNRKLQRYLYRHAAAQGVPEAQLDELFQYRHGARQKVGVIRHEPGHVGHFHVRFRRAAPTEQPPLASAKGGCYLASAWARLECRGLGSPL